MELPSDLPKTQAAIDAVAKAATAAASVAETEAEVARLETALESIASTVAVLDEVEDADALTALNASRAGKEARLAEARPKLDTLRNDASTGGNALLGVATAYVDERFAFLRGQVDQLAARLARGKPGDDMIATLDQIVFGHDDAGSPARPATSSKRKADVSPAAPPAKKVRPLGSPTSSSPQRPVTGGKSLRPPLTLDSPVGVVSLPPFEDNPLPPTVLIEQLRKQCTGSPGSDHADTYSYKPPASDVPDEFRTAF